jgi:uncharacterized cupin superfamily protein
VPPNFNIFYIKCGKTLVMQFLLTIDLPIVSATRLAAPARLTAACQPHPTHPLKPMESSMNIDKIVDFAQTTTAPEHYRPAAEKILKGDPAQSVISQYGSPCGQFNVGIWEGAVGQWKINYTEHEYCEIQQGVSIIRDAEGNGKTVRTGDRFVIPAGFSGTWEVLEDCRKVYVYFQQAAV